MLNFIFLPKVVILKSLLANSLYPKNLKHPPRLLSVSLLFRTPRKLDSCLASCTPPECAKILYFLKLNLNKLYF